MIKKLNKRNGFTLVEIVIAIGLAALFLPALSNVFAFSLSAARQGEGYTQAYTIAHQQMEAVYYLKANDPSWDWQNYPANTPNDKYYQPHKDNGIWVLGDTTANPVAENGYTATVGIYPVYRSAGDIDEVSGVNLDPTTRKIIVTVSWKEKGEDTHINLVSYVAKH